MQQEVTASEYINQEAYDYALYTVLSRGIPAMDGLNPAGRRSLWTARDGHLWKTENLGGATMPLHPHANPADVISNMAAPYMNNITWYTGEGNFGTLIQPKEHGAPRYTKVKVSAFTKDVVFRDIEIIPMVPNYDGDLMEPLHFLPLVPMAVMNPVDKFAVGYSSTILPRDLSEVITNQLQHLAGKKIVEPVPYFKPIDARAVGTDYNPKTGKLRWIFDGSFERKNTSEVIITKLPFGVSHSDVTKTLMSAIDKGKIVDFDDNTGKGKITINVKFPRGNAADYTDEQLLPILGIRCAISENMNIVNYDSSKLNSWTYVDLIKEYTDWRLTWYLPRYKRLLMLLREDIQKYRDILLAIKKNVAGSSKKSANRTELKELCESIGIVYIDYIADLPIYRFTEDEATKVENKLADALVTEANYLDVIANPDRRKTIYITELKEVLKKYG